MLKVRVGITAEDALSYESEKIYVITMDSEVDAIKSKINIVDSISKFRPHLCHEKTQEVINMRLQFPGATNAELARRLSISREWVRQVLNRANLPTRAQSEYCELA